MSKVFDGGEDVVVRVLVNNTDDDRNLELITYIFAIGKPRYGRMNELIILVERKRRIKNNDLELFIHLALEMIGQFGGLH